MTDQPEITEADLVRLRDSADLAHCPTPLTYKYRMAVEGEGAEEFASLGYQWTDKPHRLVWGLCREIERDAQSTADLRAQLEQAQAEVGRLRRALEGISLNCHAAACDGDPTGAHEQNYYLAQAALNGDTQ